ncbi:MAG: plasmid replication initiator protein [Actinomycetota bacterium]
MAGDPKSYDLTASAFGEGPHPPILLEAFERTADGFAAWDRQVRHAGYCCRPIRIRGRVEQLDRASGEVRTVFSTEAEPDNTLLVACGSRRAAKCRSCSSWYQRDAFHLVRSGLQGGKGVPESVGDHPRLFVTLTAPSFGGMHVRREKGGRVLACRPRGTAKVCEHGRPVGCSVRHGEGDPAVGTPICPECFDYQGQVIWNAMAPRLWGRFRTYLPRELAAVVGTSQRKVDRVVKVRMVKVGEYQRLGAIHFHAIVRLDGAPPKGDPIAVAPPPALFTVEHLEAAVRRARASAVLECKELAALGRADTRIGWGAEMDVRAIRGGDPGELSNEAVAAYVAKYATKFSEALGLPQDPIKPEDDIDALEAPEHVKALVWAAVVLGGREELAGLKLREHAHGLGFGGHFLTKSRAYSTTMGALRRVRREHVRRQLAGEEAVVVDAWGRPEEEDLVEVLESWRYTGWGYQTHGEAWLAATAAARAREERALAREEMRCVA